MHLCACVSEERGDAGGAGSQVLSDTLTCGPWSTRSVRDNRYYHAFVIIPYTRDGPGNFGRPADGKMTR